jgi:hypothetical protein
MKVSCFSRRNIVYCMDLWRQLRVCLTKRSRDAGEEVVLEVQVPSSRGQNRLFFTPTSFTWLMVWTKSAEKLSVLVLFLGSPHSCTRCMCCRFYYLMYCLILLPLFLQCLKNAKTWSVVDLLGRNPQHKKRYWIQFCMKFITFISHEYHDMSLKKYCHMNIVWVFIVRTYY